MDELADETGGLALVMSGGGARAAYQVGFLRCLGAHLPDLSPPIMTGVSAGALNAAYLAALPGTLAQRAQSLSEMWSALETERVFRSDLLWLWGSVVRWGTSLISGGHRRSGRHGMVDTTPLRELLTSAIAEPSGRLRGVDEKLASGELSALAITTASYSTGQSVTWVQGREPAQWERPGRISRCTALTVDHVMASSSLPLFFPAVRIADAWYGDGGMRLTAPLAPAIHLGASRILAISTRYGATRREVEQDVATGYPPPAQIAGQLLNSVFLDQFDADALRLERINRLVSALPPEKRGDLRPVRLLLLRPSQDLGKLANEYEARLPRTFRFLTRGFGTRDTRSNDLLSLVMFQPDYLRRLMQLGEQDAQRRLPEILAFCDRG